MQVVSSLGDQRYGGFSAPISCCMRQMIPLEAMTVINRHLISVSPFQQPGKQMCATHVWKTVSKVTLWILWKYRCKRRYDSIISLLSDILPELWESLLDIVRGKYDNMSGSSEVVLKKRKKVLQLWRKLPLFTVSSQGLVSKYHHLWPLPWSYFLYITFSNCTFCSLLAFFLNTNGASHFEKKKSSGE